MKARHIRGKLNALRQERRQLKGSIQRRKRLIAETDAELERCHAAMRALGFWQATGPGVSSQRIRRDKGVAA